jgi:hypothetical protein
MEIRTMLFSSWLRYWKRSLERRSALPQTYRWKPAARRWTHRLRLEALEDRTLLSPVLAVTNLAVSGSNGAVVSNSGTFSDTMAGASITLTASAGTVVQNSNGTWSWSETTPSGAAPTAPVTIYAIDSNGQTAQVDFWLNVGQVFTVTTGVDNGNDSSPTLGSLRGAIIAADQAPSASGPNLIAFNIPTSDPGYSASTNSIDVLTPAPGLTTIPNLPDLTSPVIIDGYTQAGAQVNTLAKGDNAVLKIVLNGNLVVSDGTQQDLTSPGTTGLNLLGGDTTVRGLVINNFSGDGIDVSTNNNVVQGNYIGTDVTGEQAQGNGAVGVEVAGWGVTQIAGSASYNRIGMYGDGVGDFADRNVISANGVNQYLAGGTAGVRVMWGASYNVVAGNYIGTDANGMRPLGNYIWGVVVSDSFEESDIAQPVSGYNQIGGNGPADVADGNLISANAYDGINIAGNPSNTEIGVTVYANDMGTDVTGIGRLGNGHSGVSAATGTQGLTIEGNVIAYNGEYGVAVSQDTSGGYFSDIPWNGGPTGGVRIEGNSIHDNGALGIDLGGVVDVGTGDASLFALETPLPGVLQNDSKGHGGPNNYQDFPILASAVSSSTSTSITGFFMSGDVNGDGPPFEPSELITLDFYANQKPDNSGYGQGQTWLGSTTVMTDANGNVPSFTAPFSVGNLAGEWITATATLADKNSPYFGDTSEFSADVQATAAPTTTQLRSSANPSLLNKPVTFTATVSCSVGTPGGSVDFVDTSTNTDLGTIAVSSSGIASITISNLAVGAHIIKATYAGQGSFLGSSGTLTQQVSYHFSGFLPPLSNGLTFAVNRGIPIKFQLTDFNGNLIASLSAVTALQIFNSQGKDALGGNGLAGLSVNGNQYSYSWQTKGLPTGSYTISVTLADGTTQTKTISLTAGGNSAGLVTDGSVGTDTAGALLGGEVDLYVDNSNGDLTSDELARIQDAVNSIDTVIAPSGVLINEVSDPTQADVTLSMNTTSSLGGYAQGVLGCTTDEDQVTMIKGWSWNAGADPTQVGAAQYDFETAVMHELGHVLGLGHSSSGTSVMYASLATGTASRVLTTADLNVPDDDSGPCALHAAPAASVTGTSHSPVMSAPRSTSVPSSGSPMSATGQLFASFVPLNETRNANHSESSLVPALWQSIDALVLQRLDALLSMEAGAMGVSKDTLMRDLFLASLSSSNEV